MNSKDLDTVNETVEQTLQLKATYKANKKGELEPASTVKTATKTTKAK